MERHRHSGGGATGGGVQVMATMMDYCTRMIRALRFFWIALGIRGKTFTRRHFWFSRKLHRGDTSDPKIITF